MTANQIKWAQSHDWYIATLATGDGVLVRDEWVDMNEAPNETTGRRPLHRQDRAFNDFRTLTQWAGY